MKTTILIIQVLILSHLIPAQCLGKARTPMNIPEKIQIVLENTKPLKFARGNRLPLYLWPAMISETLDPETAKHIVRELDKRGIGLIASWSRRNKKQSLENALIIARAQKKLGVPVNVNATSCMYSFFNGTKKTAHIDKNGKTFFDTSFGRKKMGCSFALEHRKPVIKDQIEYFANKYKEAGLNIDFIWADWEVDGPLEFNRAHETSKKCKRCREKIKNIENFSSFQNTIREIRSELQKFTFSDPIKKLFPSALVGNYATYPHDGYRYWYDYFEYFVKGQPHITDQKAKYRNWHHEFPLTGYTFAMPVVYTWHRLFFWYDFKNTDYRWFYNMLKIASNAGKHTPHSTPIISFVHWHTLFDGPPRVKKETVTPFSSKNYLELLWHMLLRGTDTFYMFCGKSEYAKEVRLVHEVYAAAQEYGKFLEKGTPVTFDLPAQPGPVVSGLQLGNKVLLRRTDFSDSKEPFILKLNNKEISIKAFPDKNQIISL